MLYPFYVPAVARVDECTSLSKTRAWSVFPSLLPVDRSLAWKAAACSDSLFLSFSISAKDSRVVRANCNAILSWWPGGVSCTLTLDSLYQLSLHKIYLEKVLEQKDELGKPLDGFHHQPKEVETVGSSYLLHLQKVGESWLSFRFRLG